MAVEDMQVDPPAGGSEGIEVFEPAGPRPIKKLTKDVINQIAAAEIIHRPANAIKELLENSLDAGSTSIKITVKDGGLKLLQITDNGSGINKTDLPLLCERYATSKLQKFEDLQQLGTYGFRGEALASISYCSHVEVVTKTKHDGCGWKAHYQDGHLIPAKPGVPADPRPTAANDGTVITAEDLFYNMPLRKRAFKSPSDEYNRILDIVTKYAVHNPHVAWTCKKAGTSLPEVSTPADSTAKANIANLYTPSLANELLEVPLAVLQPEHKLSAKCKGWVSNANSNWARKGGWLLFINNRLVDSSKIRKAIDALYTAYLPKGASPWVYLRQIDPAKIDVNVHPTKSEVHFLNEDEMVDGIVSAVQTALAGANVSRSFTVQTLLPGAVEPSERRGEASAAASASSSHRKPAPNYKVRMDPTNRTLDSMVTVLDPSQLSTFAESQVLEGKEKEIPESECAFTSIHELRNAVRKGANAELMEIMQRHAFVGIVDRHMCLSLVQHSTKLYLVNHASLADEHFYHLGLRQFGAFNRLRLQPAPELRELLHLAAEDEPGILEAGLEIDEVVEEIATLLTDRKEMIDEYFSLSISDNGKVETLPVLLTGYTPNLDRLPHFLLCLGTRVNWESEKECFVSFLRELAFFYSPRPLSDTPEDAASNPNSPGEDPAAASLPSGASEEGISASTSLEEVNHQLWQLEHVLFPSFRKHTFWPRDRLVEVNQVANLPDLFRIFERC
ncbi:DNA mismatch repair protein MLH1 [Kwoniella heveanensis BCC8398]|uniref:DNA mismatch repair protein MLH1 n=1 Tax=Kwoniella heveanensis BCC8398 TaxID=1296120 RepID=A0A1B9H3H5_9TREE|nr:DNA mismatch repair protein MLH1 [Kwoniella heveanensis BCC8398]